MAGILEIKRGSISPATLNDGEFYLNKGINAVQIGSGSAILTLLPLNQLVSGDIYLNGNIYANNLGISSSYAITSSYALTTGNVLSSSFSQTSISASHASTASYVLSSNVYGPWGFNSIVTSSYAVTASFAPGYLQTNVTQSMLSPYMLISNTGSMLSPYVLNSQTSSFLTSADLSNYVTNSQTSSFVTNSQTSSFVTNSQTSSFVTNSQTSSFVTNSQTSSMTVATASYVSSSNVYGPNGFNSILTASYSQTASWAVGIIGGASSVSSSYPFNVSGSTIYSFDSNKVGTTTYNVPINNNILIGESTAADGIIEASVVIGYQAATYADKTKDSVIIGNTTGQSLANVTASNFIGYYAGINSNGSYTNLIGYYAGGNAYNASNSNFIGYNSGRGAYSGSYSTLIGYQTGYRTGSGVIGIGSNNIIIGTNITLDDRRRDSINIGGIIFATGSYSTLTGRPYSGSAAGRIGINVPVPTYNLHVSGTVAFPNLTQSSSAYVVMYDSASGQLFYTASSAIGGGNSFPYTGDAIISGSLTITGSLIVLGSASFVSTSIIYASGSNILGDTINDTQTLIGTVIVSGSQQITGSLNVTGGITGSLQGTASWANNVTSVKSGYKDIGDFSGTPTLTSSVTFSQAYSDNNYAVTVTGFDARSWTIESKDSGGFTINTNAKVPLSDKVFWVASSFNT